MQQAHWVCLPLSINLSFLNIPSTLATVVGGVMGVLTVRYVTSFLVSWLEAMLQTEYVGIFKKSHLFRHSVREHSLCVTIEDAIHHRRFGLLCPTRTRLGIWLPQVRVIIFHMISWDPLCENLCRNEGVDIEMKRAESI
jgi:hypothetical protein